MINKLTLTGESVLNLPNYKTKNVKFLVFSCFEPLGELNC